VDFRETQNWIGTIGRQCGMCSVATREDQACERQLRVTNAYGKLKEEVAFLKKVAKQTGIGFELPGFSC
jgi:hypothetical protein